MIDLNIAYMTRVLTALPPQHRATFAAAGCERLLPNYIAFAKEARWGDAGVLRSALDYIWTAIETSTADPALVRQYMSDCTDVTPDTNDFSGFYTSAALDAATAITETLRSLVSHDVQHVVDVAIFCRDTVDMYIQLRDHLDFQRDSDFEAKIQRDPLMIAELARQGRILGALEAHPALDRGFLRGLRMESSNHGVSNIGVAT